MKIALVLLSIVAVGECCLAQKPANETISSSEKIEIEKLIEQLSSTSFRERRTASRRLKSKGETILPILREALKNRNPETKKRLDAIIREVSVFETEQLLKRLVENPDSIPEKRLPFLREYSKSIGKDKKSLEFYAAMYRQEKKLFQLDQERTKFKTAIEERIAELYESYRGRNRTGDKNLTVNICAVFFLLSETKPKISHAMNFYLFSLAYHGSLPKTLRTKNDSPAKKTIGLWIQKGISAHPYQKAMLALEFNLKEGLEPSLGMIKDRMQTGSVVMYALLVVAKFGTAKHIPVLEDRFDDEREMFGHPGNGAPETYECLTKDSALLVAILLAKQKPEDYGFRNLRKSTIYLYQLGSTGFDTAADRKAAFEKWKAWKKKNLPVKAKR